MICPERTFQVYELDLDHTVQERGVVIAANQ
jgi:hypothetical protein